MRCYNCKAVIVQLLNNSRGNNSWTFFFPAGLQSCRQWAEDQIHFCSWHTWLHKSQDRTKNPEPGEKKKKSADIKINQGILLNILLKYSKSFPGHLECRIPRNWWSCLYCEFTAVFQRHEVEFRLCGGFFDYFFLAAVLVRGTCHKGETPPSCWWSDSSLYTCQECQGHDQRGKILFFNLLPLCWTL